MRRFALPHDDRGALMPRWDFGALAASGAMFRAPPTLCVPTTSSTSCDQAIFVDQATDASLPSDTVLAKIDRFG